MKIGITVNLGGYESFRFESNDWDNSYDCAMEIIHEIKKLKNYDVEQYALNYLADFIHDTERYRGKKSVSIIKKIKQWLEVIKKND